MQDHIQMRRVSHKVFKLVVKIGVAFIYILRKKLLADFIIDKAAGFLQLLLGSSSFYILIGSLL